MKVSLIPTQIEARDFLAWYIQYLSDEKFAPFLYNDREFRLWEAAHGESRSVDTLTQESLSDAEAALLRFLANRAGGWFIGTGGVSGKPQFISMKEWKSQFRHPNNRHAHGERRAS